MDTESRCVLGCPPGEPGPALLSEGSVFDLPIQNMSHIALDPGTLLTVVLLGTRQQDLLYCPPPDP